MEIKLRCCGFQTKNLSKSWLNFCITGKAKSQIRKSLRDHEQDEFEKLGKEILKILLDVNIKEQQRKRYLCLSMFLIIILNGLSYIALGRRVRLILI